MYENHPAVDLFCFCSVIFFTVTFRHPTFLFCSLASALLYNVTLFNKKSFLYFFIFIPIFALLACLNPLVSHWGDTTLFNLFGDPKKPFTFEALCYGLNMALTFIAVIMWFFCYGKVMTSEKFVYLFSKIVPSISLMLVMIFRLLPSLSKKYTQIKEARLGARLNHGTSLWCRLKEVFAIGNTLFTRELEESFDMAKSMENRNYGKKKRSFYNDYNFSPKNFVILLVYALLSVLCSIGIIKKTVSAVFYPKISFTKIELNAGLSFIVFASFLILCLLPSIQNSLIIIKLQINQLKGQKIYEH